MSFGGHCDRANVRVARTRNYRLYFFGELVSHIGEWMQTMAEAWLRARR